NCTFISSLTILFRRPRFTCNTFYWPSSPPHDTSTLSTPPFFAESTTVFGSPNVPRTTALRFSFLSTICLSFTCCCVWYAISLRGFLCHVSIFFSTFAKLCPLHKALVMTLTNSLHDGGRLDWC